MPRNNQVDTGLPPQSTHPDARPSPLRFGNQTYALLAGLGIVAAPRGCQAPTLDEPGIAGFFILPHVDGSATGEHKSPANDRTG